MKVAIVMGSKSDYPVVEKAEAMLREFGVDYETRIISAHRTPKQAEEFAANAETDLVPSSQRQERLLIWQECWQQPRLFRSLDCR